MNNNIHPPKPLGRMVELKYGHLAHQYAHIAEVLKRPHLPPFYTVRVVRPGGALLVRRLCAQDFREVHRD